MTDPIIEIFGLDISGRLAALIFCPAGLRRLPAA
jgi:hypothetical protein